MLITKGIKLTKQKPNKPKLINPTKKQQAKEIATKNNYQIAN